MTENEKIITAYLEGAKQFIHYLTDDQCKHLNMYNMIQKSNRTIYHEMVNSERNTGEYILPDGTITLIDEEDYEYAKTNNWKCKNGYLVNDDNEKLHRILMSAVESDIVDHIDRNKLNNRKTNLRFVTVQQNAQNRTKSKNTFSSYFGVRKSKTGSFEAVTRVNGKRKFIGTYTSEIAAAYGYNKYVLT